MEMQSKSAKPFESWALVELMGHQRIAGLVTEAEIGGCKFVRVDVPEVASEQALTKFLGPASIYAITPVSEATARGLAKTINAAPVSIWDAQRLVDARRSLEAPVSASTREDDEETDDIDEDFDHA